MFTINGQPLKADDVMNIFPAKNYKSALMILIERYRLNQTGLKLSYTDLAKVCHIQKTYLSRVFNGNAHLNQDQLFLALQFLGAQASEVSFIELLHERDRTELNVRREILEQKIHAMRCQEIDSRESVDASSTLDIEVSLEDYYLDPHLQMMHMYLTIDQFALNPASMMGILGLSRPILDEGMTRLRKMGLIAIRRGRVEVLRPMLHLPSDSPFIRQYQIFTRLKTLHRLQTTKGRSQYAYSLFFTADDDCRSEILSKWLLLLKQAERTIKPAPAKKLFQMNFDLLDWSEQ